MYNLCTFEMILKLFLDFIIINKINDRKPRSSGRVNKALISKSM